MKINLPAPGKPRIEMLPLIDIVFLLLVVFIYSMLSMSVHRGLSVTLPESSVADIEKQTPVSVTVKGENELYVDDVQVSLADLSHMLASESTGQATPGVLLFAEESVSYQTLFTVLDQITLAGIHDISLQAKLKK
ncbi:ExbD/TolR family protein [Desulfotignum balticum]|uniref:ExbD/TolR family protein n=1 Tax=Desulfotignum balticum TaxID=115781 RepID=UPI0004137AF8|nr:biopolymer transporter ExbD [Desulfotignum balticum]